MKSRKIGLLGAGNMASALIRGLLGANVVSKAELFASDTRSEALLELSNEYGIQTFTDNRELVRAAELVVLAVKPQVAPRVLDQVADAFTPGTLLVSIAAGVTSSAIEARVPESVRVVRAMPNTAAIVLAGATGIAAGSRATEEDLATARALFDAVGRSELVDEALLDGVTGLSGSGPAYVMVIIEALADGGVKVGLPRDVALRLAAQTVYGAAKLQLETGEHPARLKDMVTSPAGTTSFGLHALENAGIRRALIDAVEAATQRSRELGAASAKK